MKLFQKRIRLGNERGITILEIMIAIGLALGAFYFFSKMISDRANETKRNLTKMKMEQVKQMLEQYRDENDRYPTAIQGLDSLVERPQSGPTSDSWRAFIKDEDKKRYLQDEWKHNFDYESDDEGSYFIIRTYGKDGKPGGTVHDRDEEVRSD